MRFIVKIKALCWANTYSKKRRKPKKVAFGLTLFHMVINCPLDLVGAYDGAYDISGPKLYYLCGLMDEYKVTGEQPDRTEPEGMPLVQGRSRLQKCWKMKWNPCCKPLSLI